MNRSLLLVFACLAIAACKSETARDRQLENVAKDWSLVIRASQVMPVYPMTEDLFPGDVFLVQTPIADQQDAWNEKGYLPLDNHVARLAPDAFESFYAERFGFKSADYPPKPPLSATDASALQTAVPRAAFPTYSFETKSGSGVNAALPIHGIPVGLSLLGSKSATGTVALSDARTYGVDIPSLFALVQKWAENHHDFLLRIASDGESVSYLRVVNRVYLISRVAVSIENNESVDSGIRSGIAPPVELLIPTRSDEKPSSAPQAVVPYSASEPTSNASQLPDPALQPLAAAQPPRLSATAPSLSSGVGSAVASNQATAAYNANVRALNDALDATYANAGSLQAGATFKFTAASARSVSLIETLPRPLVIGYLGFDVVIRGDGTLGQLIPTYAHVSKQWRNQEPYVLRTSRMLTAARALKKMAAANDTHARELAQELDAVGSEVPPLLPCNFYDSMGEITRHTGDSLRNGPPHFEDVLSFRGGLIATIDNLESGVQQPAFKLEDQGASGPEFIATRLEMCRLELARLESSLEPHWRLFAEVEAYTAPYQSR